jgi:hypothetical protein
MISCIKFRYDITATVSRVARHLTQHLVAPNLLKQFAAIQNAHKHRGMDGVQKGVRQRITSSLAYIKLCTDHCIKQLPNIPRSGLRASLLQNESIQITLTQLESDIRELVEFVNVIDAQVVQPFFAIIISGFTLETMVAAIESEEVVNRLLDFVHVNLTNDRCLTAKLFIANPHQTRTIGDLENIKTVVWYILCNLVQAKTSEERGLWLVENTDKTVLLSRVGRVLCHVLYPNGKLGCLGYVKAVAHIVPVVLTKDMSFQEFQSNMLPTLRDNLLDIIVTTTCKPRRIEWSKYVTFDQANGDGGEVVPVMVQSQYGAATTRRLNNQTEFRAWLFAAKEWLAINV